MTINHHKESKSKQQDCSDCGLKGIDSSRRQFNKLGLASPVLASLVSRPVVAGNCFSNILSGNLSDPNRGSCQCGWSPGGWRNRGGTINGLPTLDAWDKALFPGPMGEHPYGVLPSDENDPIITAYYPFGGYPESCIKGNGSVKDKNECYVGGVTLDQTPLKGCFLSENRPLREILNDPGGEGSGLWHCVAAYLNASLSANDSSFQYILTVDQVGDLCCGYEPVPGGMSLNAFLDYTWCEPHGTSDYVFPGANQ